jgi:hypothetical protein
MRSPGSKPADKNPAAKPATSADKLFDGTVSPVAASIRHDLGLKRRTSCPAKFSSADLFIKNHLQ